MRYRWDQADLFGAVAWMAGKVLAKDAKFSGELPTRSRDDARVDTVCFADGSCCIAESRCEGPYSSLTPDIDWEPPVFWLGTPITDEPET